MFEGVQMRIRQMGFSSKIKAHKNILTLETLKFIVEYLSDMNAHQAALRIGIPPTYASRYGHWLKKHPFVISAIEKNLDEYELKKLRRSISLINKEMESCKELLGIEV
jgi:phage terminase small subunit